MQMINEYFENSGRYYMIAVIATRQAAEYGYTTGFEDRVEHYEGGYDG